MGHETDISSLLQSSPDFRNGRPCIAGTGVTVHRIVAYYQAGLTPDEIADEYGHINLAQVHAALAYYHLNQQQIDSEIAKDKEDADDLEARQRATS